MRLFFASLVSSRRRQVIAASTVLSAVILIGGIAWMGVLNSREGSRKSQVGTWSQVLEVDPTSPNKFIVTNNRNFTITPGAPSRSDNASLVIGGGNGDNCASLKEVMPDLGADCPNVVLLKANVSSVDASGNRFKLHIQFYPYGDYSTGNFANGKGVARYPVNISIDQTTVQFPANQVMSSADVTLSIASGDPNNYPLDYYTSNVFAITGRYRDDPEAPAKPLSMLLNIAGALQSWSIDVTNALDVSQYRDGTNVAVVVTIKRSVTTKFFSIFVVSLSIYVYGRKVEPPTIAVGMGMLFALPALRNSQPGAPPIGCTADVVGFFFNMFLASGAAGLLVINYIIK
ncbi:hypothetical protein HK102_005613 [Quaeritorhiza haematococci]|nr:hypothetical protein HK102_005613 [Quaeritorhiza haematococci]